MNGLCLTGGGSRGAFQAGVLLALAESGWEWRRGAGVSVGAINVAKLVQYESFQEAAHDLYAMWLRIRNRDIKRSRPWGVLSLAFGVPSVYCTRDYLGALIRREFSYAKARAHDRRVSVGAVSWTTGEYVWRNQHQTSFVEFCEASAAFPWFFEPVKIGDETYGDGGLRNIAPLGELIREGCSEIVVIACSNPELPSSWKPSGNKFLAYLARGLGLMADEIMRTDYQAAGVRNDLAKFVERYRRVRIRIIEPDRQLDEADALTFDPQAIKAWLEYGHEIGKARIAEWQQQDDADELYDGGPSSDL